MGSGWNGSTKEREIGEWRASGEGLPGKGRRRRRRGDSLHRPDPKGRGQRRPNTSSVRAGNRARLSLDGRSDPLRRGWGPVQG